MKKTLITLLVVLLVLILSIHIPISFYPLNKILINLLEKRLDAQIICRSLKIYIWRSIVAEGVRARGKGDIALSAKNAVINYDPISLITGRLHLRCDLENVNFYKTGSIINSLSDLLHIPPLGNLSFKTIEGDFYVGRHNTITHNLTFLGDKIKIFGNALTDKDNSIRCFLYFFLKNDIVNEMPKDIQDSLQREDDQWSSIYVGIMGNYQRPLLRIITERFRMNIS